MSARTYNLRSRQAGAEGTRREIIRATTELHAERGVLGTTHEMIAKRAGVSLPTVYKNFPTRNDLIPHCTGLVWSKSPVQLDEEMFADHAEVPARLRTLTRRIFELYDYAAPWLRWSARDSVELPALRVILDEMSSGRSALVRAALSPGFRRNPPRRLVVLSAVLLEFESWRSMTNSGFSSHGAADAVSDALLALYSASQKEK